MAHDALRLDAGAEQQCRSHPLGWETTLRLRVRFSKIGKIRFIGHRDVARVAERAVRRVGLPVAYSKGYSPRMRLSFGLALPTGYESEAEYVELPLLAGAFSGDGSTQDSRACAGPVILAACAAHAPCVQQACSAALSYCTVAAALSEALPVGMDVSAATLSDGHGPSLQSAIQWCGWQFEILELDATAARKAIADFLLSDTVVTERVHKGETISSDVRSSVGRLWLVGCSDRGVVLGVELAAKPRVVRPSELIAALAPAHEMGRARRTHQWANDAAGRTEPVVPAGCANRHKELISAGNDTG